MSSCLKHHFITNDLYLQDACSPKDTNCQRDDNSSDERSEEAISKRWLAMQRNCTEFSAIKKRIESLRLTRLIGAKEFHRLALEEFSQEEQQLGHIYDIGNQKDYCFDNEFEYETAFRF